MRKLFTALLLTLAFTAPAWPQQIGGSGKVSGVSTVRRAATGSCSHAICSSLVVAWSLSNTSDASGNGHTLTNNNTATFVAGKIGNAVNLVAASSQYLSIASFAGINPNNTAFTIDFWFNPTTSPGSTMTLIGKLDDVTAGGYVIEWNGGTGGLSFKLFGASGTVASTTAPVGFVNGTDYHITAVYDPAVAGGTIFLYKNATLVGSETISGTPASTGAMFGVGHDAFPGSGYADGKIDALVFFSSALSTTHITYLDNSGAGREFPYN